MNEFSEGITQNKSPQEQITHNEPSIFTDWSSYKGEELKENLKGLGITYTKPQEDNNLRASIIKYLLERERENNIKEFTKLVLLSCLRFLEMRLMVDNFGSNEDGEDGRHKFLLNNRVRIGDEEINLYDLSKRVNKLSGNKISHIITLAQLIDNEEIEKTRKELKAEIEEIKRERGYFKPEDLDEINKFARDIISHILQS